jgi:hypothetical protein
MIHTLINMYHVFKTSNKRGKRYIITPNYLIFCLIHFFVCHLIILDQKPHPRLPTLQPKANEHLQHKKQHRISLKFKVHIQYFNHPGLCEMRYCFLDGGIRVDYSHFETSVLDLPA